MPAPLPSPSRPLPPKRPPTSDPSSAPSTSKLARHALQRLSAKDLDRLVEAWLSALGFRSVRLWERRGFISTYEAHYGGAPLPLPARVRVHQHLRHLEISHVESFLGHLVRSGSPAGILVTTGDCSWAAGLGARTPHLPFLRLCSGEEWAEELRGLGLPGKPLPGSREDREISAEDGLTAEQPRTGPTEVDRPNKVAKSTWDGGYRVW